MKSICITSVGQISIKDIPAPQKKAGNAIVKIKAVMVCGSDISAFKGRGRPLNSPRVIGHEVAGEIYEIEENGRGLKAGDRAILNPYLYCGGCYPCSLGRTNACESLKVLGAQVDGAMAEYFSHPVDLLIKAPDSIPWEAVPLAEPLTISLHALHRTQLQAGEHIAIIGAGPIGVYAALAANVYGATPILLDVLDSRLQLAKDAGVPYTINTANCDAVEAIREITNGRMAEVVVEASGNNSQIQKTLEYASCCGRIALSGWPKDATPLMTPLITLKELDIRGSRTGIGSEFEEALRLIESGQVDVLAALTKLVPFDELPDAIRSMAERPQDFLKVGALL